jgi:D-alanyl-D-alanine carboxypeptidase
VTPVVVYTGPTRTDAQISALAAIPEAADPPAKKKGKHKAAKGDGKKADASPAPAATPAAAKPADGVAKTGKPTGSATHWTPTSSASLAASPPPELKPSAPAALAKKPVKPKPAASTSTSTQ